jgi:mannose-1-phosphate guanylyltransferase/phosphomannomutase
MAGGEGSRLRPLTCNLPKPMVSIMNRPVMEHTINLLKYYGITDIGITLMYHPQHIKDFFGSGKNFGVNITYFIEETPLGTAGGIKSAESFLDEPFIVISGDSLTNLDISKAIDFHKQKKSIATLILTKVAVPLDYGVVLTNDNGSITGFLEKPSWGEIFSDTVNTGTYILEPEIFNYIEPNVNTDFSRDVFPNLLSSSKRMFGYIMSDYWCDIGDIRSYVKSHCDILEQKIKIDFEGTQIKKNVWVGNGTIIDSNAEINGPCIIGSNCKIGNGTLIDNYSIIGNNTIIEDDVSVVRSIIWDNCYVGYGSELRGAILCNQVNLKHYVSVFENAVIGEACRIHERVIIKPDIKIWPKKTIESFAIIDRNMIWGSKHSNKIFGENGISGIINVDISPEFATRLGAAYGSQFKTGSKVVVSSTNSNPARMFKHAFISGILSVGVEVYNMSSLLTPIARFAIGFLAVEGGIHIKTDIENENLVRVDFMDARGAAISRFNERKIENSFFKEDFKRCSAGQISRLNNITDFSNYYMRSITSKANIAIIREKNLKVCIFSKSEYVLSIVVAMLNDLNCTVNSFLYNNDTDLDALIGRISDTSSDFAAVIDKNGENLALIDKTGKIIKDDAFQAFVALIIFKTAPSSTFYVPVTASEVIDKLACKYNGVVKRTKNCSQAVMDEILNNADGKYPEQMILSFDAIAGLINILEYICISNTTLGCVISEIPDFFIVRKDIHCPWELKGSVMRTIINDQKEKKIELVDGIKLYTNQGWVLIMPDADKPIFRIITESSSQVESEALCEKYYNLLERIIGAIK